MKIRSDKIIKTVSGEIMKTNEIKKTRSDKL